VTTTEQLPAAAPSAGADPDTRASHAVVEEHTASVDRPRRFSLVVGAVALLPFVWGAVAIIRRGFPQGALFGDRAILALNAIDAWRAPALLGPYSRFFWHHPGPLYFYVLNAWTTVFGSGTVALVLGAVAINVAASAGILVVAWRRGGRALLVWCAVLLTAYLVVTDPYPYDIWNPSVTLLPFALVLLLAWSLADRDWWVAPWLAFVASFCVQTHVGLAPGVLAAVAFAVVAAVWRRRRSADRSEASRRTIRRAVATSGAVLFVVWLPAVIEQVTSADGNLSALARFFAKPGSPHSWSEGVENTALQATLIVRGAVRTVTLRNDLHQLLGPALVVTGVALAVAIFVVLRARVTAVLLLLGLVVLELLVAIYAVTRVVDDIQYYLVQWISAVGFVLWLAVGAAAIEYARARWTNASWFPGLRRGCFVVLLVVLCVGTLRAFPGHSGEVNENLNVPNDRTLFGYVPVKVLLGATSPDQTVVLRLDSVTSWEVVATDALLLRQHGRHVEVIDDPVTRLLFDDAMRVDDASGHQVFAFRDRGKARLRAGETVIAHQGKWSIVRVDQG
jgi:hypothetical protein